MKVSTPNGPTFLFDDLPLDWQMTRCEKYAFSSLLEAADPEVAIEIGTYRGGSLQIVSKAAEKVYSIDVSSNPKELLQETFSNVNFLVGDSRFLLPNLLRDIGQNKESLGFVLIDGDHTTDGVRSDINAVLQHVPIRPVYIVFHDSFNPECRAGILSADWHSCPYVHFIEIDFIPGVYHYESFDTAPARSMWGGLAVAVMQPEKRSEPLTIHQAQKGLFDAIYLDSVHSDAAPRASDERVGFKRRIANRLRHLVGPSV